jgi:hypothetical protein
MRTDCDHLKSRHVKILLRSKEAAIAVITARVMCCVRDEIGCNFIF